MTLLPGLRPFTEDRPDVSAARGAVPQQEARIRAPGLSPAASPLNTFVRPPTAPQDDSAQRLAAALSGMNPSLQRFASVLAEEGKDEVSSSVQAKILKAGSTQEVEKLIETDPEMATGLGKAAASRRLGQLLAAQAVNEAKTRYQNDFDRVNGNVGQLTSEVAAPFLEKYGHDPIFRKQFMDDITPGVASITSADAQTKAADAYQRTQDDQTKIFTGIVTKAIDAGKSPEEAAAAVVGEFYGNERILKLPYAEQQKALVPVVRALAEQGRYDVVKALGETESKGERLLDNATVGPAVAQAMSHARQVRDRDTKDATVAQRQDAYSKFHEGQATPEEEAALLKRAQAKDGFISEEAANGWVQVNRNKREALQEQARKEAERVQLMDRLNSQEAQLTSTGVEAFRTGRTFSLPQVTILNKKGEEEVLGGDKFRERAAADFEQWSAQYAQQKGESWDQTVLREAPIYAQNGFAPKKWKDMLSLGGASISASALSGEDPPESAQRGYALYKLLHANSSRLLNDLVPKDQRDLYEMWRVGEEDAGLAPGKSLLLATEATNDPAGRLKRISSVTAKDIKAKVGSLGSTFGTLFGGQSAPENLGDMAATIQRLAEQNASLGLGADKAIQRAVERVQQTHVNINGFWIDASDRRIPEGFPELVGDVLKSYAEKHGKAEGLDAGDLTIRPLGGAANVWRIVRKRDGVAVDAPKDAVFKTDDLLKARASRDAATDQQTLQRMRESAQRPVLPNMEARDINLP